MRSQRAAVPWIFLLLLASPLLVLCSQYYPIDWQQVVTSAPTAPAASDIGTCVCDLTAHECDVDCCCDAECTPAAVSLFARCLPSGPAADPLDFCANSTLLGGANRVTVVNSSYASGSYFPSQMCIVISNSAVLGLYYADSTSLTTVEAFEAAFSNSAGYSYSTDVASTPSVLLLDSYKSDDLVRSVYASPFAGGYLVLLSFFGLPQRGPDASCLDGSGVVFLQDAPERTCVRRVSQLALTCSTLLSAVPWIEQFRLLPDGTGNSALALNMLTWRNCASLSRADCLLQVAATISAPAAANATLNTNSTRSRAAAGGGYSSIRSVGAHFLKRAMASALVATLPRSYFNNKTGRCENVLLKLHYNLYHNDAGVIVRATADLLLGSVYAVDTGGADVSQTFSLSFLSQASANASTSDTVVRSKSGAPGYVVGKPVLAATSVQADGKEAMQQAQDEHGGWQLLLKDGEGVCVSAAVAAATAAAGTVGRGRAGRVRFGENSLSACTMPLRATDLVGTKCSAVRQRALDVLLATLNVTHIGRFGDANYLNSFDWLILLKDIPSLPADDATVTSGCTSVPSEVRLEFVTQPAGAYGNEQLTITGARLSVHTAPWEFRCTALSCSSQQQQWFELRAVVTFVADVTPELQQQLKVPPALLPTLPSDFFYPLTR